MQYTKLGNTGLDVSRICLGCMSFGDIAANWTHSWVLNEDDTRVIIKQALEMGINFFDTANIYSLGTSEEYLGRALRDYANRDEIVLATKVFQTMRPGPNGGGLSRKAILAEIDHSLKRLGTDYVDLYIIHRWDYNTPIEETMQALHDVVRAGKARYIGASAMYAWQFQKAQYVAQTNGLTKFVSMQNHYNLLYREDEREMMPLCRDMGIGVTPYSPLAAGRLARDPEEMTRRYETDKVAMGKYDTTMDTDRVIIDRLGKLSQERGIPRAQLSLAWLLQKPQLAAPVIGATRASQLEDAVAAVDITLSAEECAFLEEPYVPHKVVGAR